MANCVQHDRFIDPTLLLLLLRLAFHGAHQIAFVAAGFGSQPALNAQMQKTSQHITFSLRPALWGELPTPTLVVLAARCYSLRTGT